MSSSLSTPVLEAQGITKKFQHRGGEISILKGVDLRVFAGESVCITGSSGAGKSTLLHVLGTLDRPTTGALRFFGEEVSQQTDDQLARFRGEKVGFVFQFHHLLAELTALENVALPLRLAGQSMAQARPIAEKWLKDLNLSHRTTHFPTEMSGGEQQRVALARALVRKPAVLFADEPTGNLDSANGAIVQDLMFQLRRDLNIALVVVTHDQKFASRFARKLVLHDGGFRAVGAE